MNWSYWEHDSYLKDIDYLIIGAGLVGLFSAVELLKSKPNARVVILERGSLSQGASTKNGGFTCFGSLSEIIDDLQHMSREDVYALIKMRYDGLNRMMETLGKDNIGYEDCKGYEVFKSNDQELLQTCLKEMPQINQDLKRILSLETNVFDVCTGEANQLGLKQPFALIRNNFEGSVHTGKLYRQLLSKVNSLGGVVLNGVEVVEVNNDEELAVVKTSKGLSIKAHQVVLATNAFTKSLFPEMPINAVRNQVLVSKEIPGLKLNGTFHYDAGYVYFRHVGNRILIGGARNMDPVNSETDQFGLNPELHKVLIQHVKDLIDCEVDEFEFKWSGILGVNKDKTPIIKRLNDKVIFAVKMGGMGVAISSQVGLEVLELIDNQ